MTRLDFASYLQLIGSESAHFREVLAECDPAAKVPSCPDWDAADLLWHLGTVQHFWSEIIRTRPTGPEEEAEPPRPATYAELLEYYDTASAALVSELGAADPAEQAWTWAPEQTVGFTFRRQAHEALIHRLDAEQAAGLATMPLDPGLATDGVAELLEVMYGGCPPWGHFAPLPQHLRIDLTDTGVSLWVQPGIFSGTDPDSDRSYVDEPDIALVDDPGTEPDVVITGPSGDLDTWMWKRGDESRITVEGDDGVRAHWNTVVAQPLN